MQGALGAARRGWKQDTTCSGALTCWSGLPHSLSLPPPILSYSLSFFYSLFISFSLALPNFLSPSFSLLFYLSLLILSSPHSLSLIFSLLLPFHSLSSPSLPQFPPEACQPARSSAPKLGAYTKKPPSSEMARNLGDQPGQLPPLPIKSISACVSESGQAWGRSGSFQEQALNVSVTWQGSSARPPGLQSGLAPSWLAPDKFLDISEPLFLIYLVTGMGPCSVLISTPPATS